MRAEEKRQGDRKQNKLKLSRRGRRARLSSVDKLKLAERTEACYPEGVAPEDCWFSHARPVWRLEQGRAVLIAYQLYRGPGSRFGCHSDNGCRFVERLLTVVQTLRVQKPPVLQYLKAALTDHRNGTPTAKLLPVA